MERGTAAPTFWLMSIVAKWLPVSATAEFCCIILYTCAYESSILHCRCIVCEGYIGQGMMSAAVHGSVFASPGPATVLAALRAVGHDHPRRFKALFLCICKMNATILCIAALYCMAASPQKVFLLQCKK